MATRELRTLQLLAATLRSWSATIKHATCAADVVVALDADRELLAIAVTWPAVGGKPAGEYHRTWAPAEIAGDKRRGCDWSRAIIGAVLEARGISSAAPTRRELPAREP